MPMPSTTPREHGFTLVEVMVAMSVLLIGVLGTVTMVDSANSLTSRNKSREGATALGRSVLEIARGIPYRDLTSANLLDELEARDGFEDVKPGVTGHQVESEGYVYTVTPTICAMDDPADSLGLQAGVGIAFCADTDTTTSPTDRNADDYRRVSIALSWRSGPERTETTTQRAVVSNPVGGLGPSITALTQTSPTGATITSAVSQVTYSITTSTFADGVTMTVNGANPADATGSGLDWAFTWGLGAVDSPTYFDCTYVVQATAFDDQDRAGAAKALTVTLNRRVAFAPTDFTAGRNLNGSLVDISWSDNRECDVTGYRVYRGATAGTITTLVCQRDVGEALDCIDDPGAGGFPAYYQVVAVDSDSNGVAREGNRTAAVAVTSANANAPDAPTGLTVCSGGNPDCFDIDGDPAPAGTAVLSWEPSTDPDGDEIAFYRIYRDGDTYADRFHLMLPVTGKPLVFVDGSVTGSHTYRVSAVDEHMGESVLSGAVTWE